MIGFILVIKDRQGNERHMMYQDPGTAQAVAMQAVEMIERDHAHLPPECVLVTDQDGLELYRKEFYH